ncbi:unnamed protein product [Closterium sp. NIES-65]|nr:unnamed protein product [Closterium sp. NIES-65]
MTPTGLVGFGSFLRNNPRTDRFKVDRFHHIEFWCGDATNTYGRFSWGLGLPVVAKSDQTTGNHTFCSFVLKAEDLALVFTAPYSEAAAITREEEMGEYEELGILVDVDAGGVLLQIFTAPIRDRPTVFIAILQGVVGVRKKAPRPYPPLDHPIPPHVSSVLSLLHLYLPSGPRRTLFIEISPTVFIEILQRVGVKKGLQAVPMQQFPRGGCGGFGTGNLLELFRSLDTVQTPSKVYL